MSPCTGATPYTWGTRTPQARKWLPTARKSGVAVGVQGSQTMSTHVAGIPAVGADHARRKYRRVEASAASGSIEGTPRARGNHSCKNGSTISTAQKVSDMQE